jgi:hypothetical protein
MLESLEQALHDADPAVSSDRVEALEARLAGSGHPGQGLQDLIRSLKRRVCEYDFEQALADFERVRSVVSGDEGGQGVEEQAQKAAV